MLLKSVVSVHVALHCRILVHWKHFYVSNVFCDCQECKLKCIMLFLPFLLWFSEDVGFIGGRNLNSLDQILIVCGLWGGWSCTQCLFERAEMLKQTKQSAGRRKRFGLEVGCDMLKASAGGLNEVSQIAADPSLSLVLLVTVHCNFSKVAFLAGLYLPFPV